MAKTAGLGSVSVVAGGNVTGVNGAAIDAEQTNATSNNGVVHVTTTANKLITAFGADAIHVVNQNGGANATVIDSNAAIKVSGGAGVSAQLGGSGVGGLTITTAGAIGSGSGGPGTFTTGVSAVNTGASNADISVTVRADIGAAADRAQASGVLAQQSAVGSGGNITVTLASGNVYTTGVGVQVSTAGAGNLTISGTGSKGPTIDSSNGVGVMASSTGGGGGNILIDLSQTVNAATSGILAATNGGGNINIGTLSGGSDVTAANGVAISAVNSDAGANSGNINVFIGSNEAIKATGGNSVVVGLGQSAGVGSVINNGQISAVGQIGVAETSAKGGLTFTNSGVGTVTANTGVSLGSVDGSLQVGNFGSIQGATTGVNLATTGQGGATVTNNGAISGGANAVIGSSNNTAFTLNNNAAATLTGAVSVTGSNIAASAFTNAGSWTAETGASSFNGAWTNSGVTTLGAGGTISIGGAANNSGTINLQNAATNNRLTINGAYAGGGVIGVDANTANATSDQITISGAASGTTKVYVQETGRGVLPGGFLTIVTVAPGASATTFSDAGTLPQSGFLLEKFGQNPNNNTQFGVIQTVNPDTAALAGISSLADTVSGMLDEPLSAYVTEMAVRPDPNSGRFGLWMRGRGGNLNQSVSTTLSGANLNQTVAGSQNISILVLQAGGDWGLTNVRNTGINVHLGVTGGATDGTAQQGGVHVVAHSSFVGGYLFFNRDGLTVDAAMRHEWRRFELIGASLFGNANQVKDLGHADDVSVQAAYRWTFAKAFAITPMAGLVWSTNGSSPITLNSYTTYQQTSDSGLTYQAGARVTYAFALKGLVLEPYAGARYLHNSHTEQGQVLLNNGTGTSTYLAATTPWRGASRFDFGLNMHGAGGGMDFFAGGTLNSGSLHGTSFSAGARLSF